MQKSTHLLADNFRKPISKCGVSKALREVSVIRLGWHWSILVAAGLSMTGCAVEPTIAKKITFPAAMRDLTAGFEVLRNTAPSSERRLGLAPTEVTASLELTTLANGELGVDLSATPTSLFSKIGITGKQEQKITRKNTVQITFKNIYVDKDGKPYNTTKPPPIIQQFMNPPEARANEE